jgi:hypothetical protein
LGVLSVNGDRMRRVAGAGLASAENMAGDGRSKLQRYRIL